MNPTNEEVRQAIETLLTYSLFTEGGEVREMATNISSVVESGFNCFSKQTTIKDLFKKQQQFKSCLHMQFYLSDQR